MWKKRSAVMTDIPKLARIYRMAEDLFNGYIELAHDYPVAKLLEKTEAKPREEKGGTLQ
jgi:hypothetical protein